jgi:long-subunit fatty acid transport protein
MRFWVSPLLLGALLLLARATPARAGLVGSIYSGPTTADAAALYWNPGAMTLMDGTHGMLFGGLSLIRLSYLRDTPSPQIAEFPRADVFVPKPSMAFGVVTDAGLDRWRFGLGLSLPVLDGASWKAEYGGLPASTRYYALNARQMMFKISPAAAFRLARFLSVGVGVDVELVALTHEVYTDFGAKINQMACRITGNPCLVNSPLPREDPTYQGLTRIDGVGVGVGVFGGVLIAPWPWLSLGVGFHSGSVGPVKVPVDMQVQIPTAISDWVASKLPSLVLPELRARGEVKTSVPMTVAAGIALEPLSGLELVADLHWTDFSTSGVMIGNVTRSSTSLIGDQVLIKGRSDDILVGLRGSYWVLPVLNLALRLEYQTNTRPDRWVSPISVDFHRWSVHLGAAWRATRWLTLTLEYGHYFLLSRTVSDSTFGPNANPTTPEEEGLDKPPPTGDYRIDVDRVGLGLQTSF